MMVIITDIFYTLERLKQKSSRQIKTLLDCKTNINGFINKLTFCSAQIATKRLIWFPNLAICEPSQKVIKTILNYLANLKLELENRFAD